MRTYIKSDDLLLLNYAPDAGMGGIEKDLEENGDITFARTFHIFKDNFSMNDDGDSFTSIIGRYKNGFLELDRQVFGIEHNILFGSTIQIKDKFLTRDRVSIILALDHYAKEDLCIVPDDFGLEVPQGTAKIPLSTYLDLISKFPTPTELLMYKMKSIDSIVGDFFNGLPDYSSIYDDYISKHRKLNFSEPLYPQNSEIVIFELENARKELKELLSNLAISELEWQRKVARIVLLLYPKYLLALTSVAIKEPSGKQRQLDFLLVDNLGNVDVLEIKKPFEECIMSQSVYRDNYLPRRELNGAIIQSEKYLYYLTSNQKINEELINRLEESNLNGLKVNIRNPQAFILAGRSSNLSDQQLLDFEIIKRSHKNIVEIMTYDDLLIRIENALSFLRKTMVIDDKRLLKAN
jgi:hypothetical protein